MRGGFIEDQDSGIAEEGSRDGNALALPAGELHPALPHLRQIP